MKGSGSAADPYSAFDNANEHIATRLRRHKTKLSAHKSKIGLAELAYSAVLPLVEQDEEVDVNEDAPLTIAETNANIPVCTVSEAVMLMDLGNECARCSVTAQTTISAWYTAAKMEISVGLSRKQTTNF